MPCAADRAWHADGLGSGRGREGEGLLTPLRIRSRALPHRTHAVDHRPGAREGQHRQAHPQRVSRSRVRVVSAQDKQTSAGTVELKPIVAAGQSSCRNALRFGRESASKTAQPRRKPSTAAACAVHVSVCGTRRVQHVHTLTAQYAPCCMCCATRVRAAHSSVSTNTSASAWRARWSGLAILRANTIRSPPTPCADAVRRRFTAASSLL